MAEQMEIRGLGNDCIKLMLKGELLPYPIIECIGIVYANPKFNPEYAKPHEYEHSTGYPDERHICVCGEEETALIHKEVKHE